MISVRWQTNVKKLLKKGENTMKTNRYRKIVEVEAVNVNQSANDFRAKQWRKHPDLESFLDLFNTLDEKHRYAASFLTPENQGTTTFKTATFFDDWLTIIKASFSAMFEMYCDKYSVNTTERNSIFDEKNENSHD